MNDEQTVSWQRPLVFLDVETTGYSPAVGSRVTEVGAIRVENGKITGVVNTLVNPEIRIPGSITRLTGITDHDVASAPSFSSVLHSGGLRDLLDGAVFVAHNVDFDYGFIQNEFILSNDRYDADRLCTVRLSRALYPGVHGHSLEKIIARHGFGVDRRHRAYDDAGVLYRFYLQEKDRDESRLHQHMDRLMIRSRY